MASIIEPKPQRLWDYIYSITLNFATNSDHQNIEGQVPGYPSVEKLIPSNLIIMSYIVKNPDGHQGQHKTITLM